LGFCRIASIELCNFPLSPSLGMMPTQKQTAVWMEVSKSSAVEISIWPAEETCAQQSPKTKAT
jgi:hypothetical protein